MGSGAGLKPISDGLIFHVDSSNDRFYSGVGNTTYELTGRFSAVISGGMTADPANLKSFVFDGVNDYLEFGVLQPTRYTISLWFKATGVPSLNDIYGGFLYSNNPQHFGAVSLCVGYRWDTNRLLVFQSSGGDVSSASVPANKTTHAVCTYDGTNIKIYIDGVLTTTTSYATDPSYPGSGNLNMKLGAWGHPGYERYFNGNIYQASIYSRALSASEILNLYNSNRKKFIPTENISTDGLILHIDPSVNTCYPGTGTTVYDLSSNAYVASMVNGAAYSNNRTGALYFDGANDYVQFYNALLSGTQDFTIESWVYSTKSPVGSQGAGSESTVIGTYPAGALQIFYGYFYMGMYLNNGSAYVPNSQVIYQYGPTQLTATRSGSNLSIYLDGNLVDTGSSADSVGTTTNFRMGSNSGGGERFMGYIYNLKIYNRALPQSEIINNYDALKRRYKLELPRITNNLMFELDFADKNCYPGTGTTVYDLSSFRTNGSVMNGATFVGTGTTSSFSFDGVDDHLTFPYNSSQMNFPDNNATISVWFRYNSSDTIGSLITQRGNSGFQLYVVNSKFYVDGGGTASASTTHNLNNGNNYNAVAVFDRTNSLLRLYLNGIADNTTAYTGSIQDTFTILLAKSNYGDGPLTANIYAAQVYNRVLSASEILQNYNYNRGRFGI
jgi:hypothetical protein